MLAQRTVSGIFWNFFDQLLRRGVGVLVTLFLARFLVPEDFGLLAMITVFIAIASALMDSGIQQAVIRKLDPDDVFFSTAFYSNLALGLVAYTFLCLAAPSISDFYQEPRLVVLVRVAGLVVLVNSFQVIQSALLSRDLDFRTQMRAGVPAAVVSGIVAVILAYMGLGVWALIVQTLLSALLVVVILWSLQSWRPKFVFSVLDMKEMYGFGYKLFFSGLLDTVAKNIYILVIAKLFSASIAGLYFFAERIKDLVIYQLVVSVQKVTYPALSTLQNDNQRLKQGYRQVMQVTTFLLFPAIFLLAALAQPLFEVFFPERWLPAVPYLQLICVAGVLYPVHSINLNILKVKGRSDLFLGLEIYKKIVLFVVLYISYEYGVVGILVGKGIQSVLAYIPNSYYSKSLIGYSVREQLSDLMPSLVLSAVVSLIVYLLTNIFDAHPLLELIILSSCALFAYLFIAKLMSISAFRFSVEILVQRSSFFKRLLK